MRERTEHEKDHDNSKKRKTGFRVGPANLPDGSYKRKTQEIKQSLIDRAKIRKNYERLKKSALPSITHENIPPLPVLNEEVHGSLEHKAEDDAGTSFHPERAAMLRELPDRSEAPDEKFRERRRRPKTPRMKPFEREHQQAQHRKAALEEYERVRQEASEQRRRKLAERERFRKAMSKARAGGSDRQRKLGRESKVLLERVQRMVQQTTEQGQDSGAK